MKSTGMVRHIDELGRIVLPIELRRVFGIDIGTPLEIYWDGSQIMLKVYQGSSTCFLCRDAGSELKYFKGKVICEKCVFEALEAAKPVTTTPQS